MFRKLQQSIQFLVDAVLLLISRTKLPFDSKRWKRDYGIRKDLIQDVNPWIVGKSEAEVREWLGEPDWIGTEGVVVSVFICKPRHPPKFWNYILTKVFKGDGLQGAAGYQVRFAEGIVTEAMIVTLDKTIGKDRAPWSATLD
jgi:hypothetical protein